MFSISSLYPFVQLMAGINFIPTFISELLDKYIKYLYLSYKKYSDNILLTFDREIEDIKISKGNINLNHFDKENLLDAVKEKKSELEKLTFLKEVKNDLIIGYSENLFSEHKEFIKKEGEQKLPHSFIMSSIFCINFLIFIPIFNVYLPNVNPIIIFKIYLLWSIIIHLVFQLILNKVKNNYSIIIILYIIFSIFLSVLIIISFNGSIPQYINSTFEFISLKLLIPLFVISSFFTFIFYFTKHNILSFKNHKKLNKKAIIEINELKNNCCQHNV